jgi:hypothetical protein
VTPFPESPHENPPGADDGTDPLPLPNDPDRVDPDLRDTDTDVVVSGSDGRHRHRSAPGYHDPTYRIGGAAPARSALTLRLVLSVLGVVLFGLGAVVVAVLRGPAWEWIVLAVVAILALVNLGVVARRRRHGEPG